MSALFLCYNIVTAQAPVSGTYTINAGQPTAGTNFQTFTEAVFSLAYGVNGPVVFNVAPNSGPYNEQINISTIPGTSAINTVTFNCNGVTLQNASTSNLSRAVVKLDAASHIIFDSLHVIPITTDDDLSYGWGFAILRNSDSNVIRKSSVTVGVGSTHYSQNNIGIYVGSTDDYPSSNGISDCDGNIISDNTINGGYWGIVLDNYGGNAGLPFSSINNNQIINNKVSNFLNNGIYMIWTRNTLVQGNEISGALGGTAQGINLDEQNLGVKITGNRIHNISMLPSATSFDFKAITISFCIADADNPDVISNNLVYDIRNQAAQAGISIIGSAYVNIYHNTVILDTAGADPSSSTSGFLYDYGNQNVNFENNIISVQRTGSTSIVGLNISDAASAFVSDYNDVLVDATNNFGSFDGTNYATLIAWQNANPTDAHSASINPIFSSVATGIFKPTNAALDNLGIFAGISTDINNDIRNNTHPDLGAYEFLTPACATAVAGGTSVAVPALSVCEGGQRTLNLNGNTFGTGQTYQWQSSATLNGVYTNVSNQQIIPSFDVFPATSLYYRAVVACGAGSANSDPILVSVNRPLAGDYTINSGAATGANNFKSFGDVLLAFKCGITGPVTLNVVAGSGPYNEQVVINEVSGASAINTITINGNGETLSYLSTKSTAKAVLRIDGADHIVVDSLTVTAPGAESGEYGYGIQLMNDADSNVIRNCKVNINTTSKSSNFAGIVVSSSASDAIGSSASKCDHNKITRNTITGGYYGITLYSDPDVEKIFNDTISNNIIRDVHAYGIFVTGTDHALIEGNDISRPTREISSTTFNGIYFTHNSNSLTVSKNRIHNTFDAKTAGSGDDDDDGYDANGIYLNNCDADAGSVNIISNNLVYNFGGDGNQVGLYNNSSDNAFCYHNTISLDNVSGTSTEYARGIYQTGDATGLAYTNNNITITRNSTGVNHGIYMRSSGTTFTADHNNYYIAGTGTNNTGYFNSTSFVTLADWKTGSGVDSHSLAVNPLYTDAINGNLLPTKDSLDNAGLFVGITTDITGLPRSATTPDIGAYEFIGVLPVKLLNIVVAKSLADVIVNWTTVSEINAKMFVVERSVNGIDFTVAGSLPAKGLSSNYQQYTFTDKNAANIPAAKVLYYRLKMVDNNGHTEYSRTVVIRFDRITQMSVNVSPNPFVSELYVSIATAEKGRANIQVKDIVGRTLLTQVQDISTGTTLINIANTRRLASGTYLVTVELNGNHFVQQVIK